MKRFGLIGNPISTSKSPALFNAGYHGKYTYTLIEEPHFEDAWESFLGGYDGINVTAPFKLDAFARADIRSGVCEKLGAANLLLKTSEGIAAFNTDFAGIVLSILDAVSPDGGYGFFIRHGEDFSSAASMLAGFFGHTPRALIAGCGGAGRAAAAAAATLGCDTVLMNRTPEKALAIAGDMPGASFRIARSGDFPEMFAECDLTIYTIPGKIEGLEQAVGHILPGSRKIVLEANYKDPSFSGKELGDRGATYISGRRWLLYQALTGFRIFTGENPDFEGMCKVI